MIKKIMLVFVTIFVCLILLCACNFEKEQGDYLSYQKDIKRMTGRAKFNGTDLDIELSVTGGGRVIAVTSSERLSGVRFVEQNSGGYMVQYGDFSTFFLKSDFCDRLLSFVSIASEDVVGTEIERASGETVCVLKLSNGSTVHLSEQGEPLMFSDGELMFYIEQTFDE